MIPKFIKVSFTLNVVHDHSLGWDFNTGNWRGGLSAPRFPYDFGMIRDTGDSPGSGINESTVAAAPGSTVEREATAAAFGVTDEAATAEGKSDMGAKTTGITPKPVDNPLSNL